LLAFYNSANATLKKSVLASLVAKVDEQPQHLELGALFLSSFVSSLDSSNYSERRLWIEALLQKGAHRAPSNPLRLRSMEEGSFSAANPLIHGSGSERAKMDLYAYLSANEEADFIALLKSFNIEVSKRDIDALFDSVLKFT